MEIANNPGADDQDAFDGCKHFYLAYSMIS